VLLVDVFLDSAFQGGRLLPRLAEMTAIEEEEADRG